MLRAQGWLADCLVEVVRFVFDQYQVVRFADVDPVQFGFPVRRPRVYLFAAQSRHSAGDLSESAHEVFQQLQCDEQLISLEELLVSSSEVAEEPPHPKRVRKTKVYQGGNSKMEPKWELQCLQLQVAQSLAGCNGTCAARPAPPEHQPQLQIKLGRATFHVPVSHDTLQLQGVFLAPSKQANKQAIKQHSAA
jgi:hypothetical protein